MTITRKFVADMKEGHEKEYAKQVIKGYMDNDKWAVKALKNVGVLLTAHPNTRPFLKASVNTHKKLGFWVTVAYDNYFDPKNKGTTYDSMLPRREVFDNIDTFLISHYQTWGGVLYPYFWLLKLGLQTMGGFEYVFCSNGDCILEKPEGFPKIMEMLGDADIMGCGWENNNGRELFNTTSFIAKTTAAQAIMKHFQDHLIPIDNYEKYAERVGNTESRFAVAIKDLGLKVKKVPKNPPSTQLHKPGGTWNEILGFRHVHGEWNYAHRYKDVPPPAKYIDETFWKKKREMVNKYYETKDKKFLNQWYKLR
jgi:hypothetical protein